MAARGIISTGDVPELRAAIVALSRLDKTVRRDINRQQREALGPIWTKAVDSNLMGRSRMDARTVGAGVRVRAGNPPTLMAATKGASRIGDHGLTVGQAWPWFEFGVPNPNLKVTYRAKSKNGGTHTVTRRALRGLPRRQPKGRIAYAAARESGPRIVSLFVQTVVRGIHNAVEGIDS